MNPPVCRLKPSTNSTGASLHVSQGVAGPRAGPAQAGSVSAAGPERGHVWLCSVPDKAAPGPPSTDALPLSPRVPFLPTPLPAQCREGGCLAAQCGPHPPTWLGICEQGQRVDAPPRRGVHREGGGQAARRGQLKECVGGGSGSRRRDSRPGRTRTSARSPSPSPSACPSSPQCLSAVTCLSHQQSPSWPMSCMRHNGLA